MNSWTTLPWRVQISDIDDVVWINDLPRAGPASYEVFGFTGGTNFSALLGKSAITLLPPGKESLSIWGSVYGLLKKLMRVEIYLRGTSRVLWSGVVDGLQEKDGSYVLSSIDSLHLAQRAKRFYPLYVADTSDQVFINEGLRYWGKFYADKFDGATPLAAYEVLNEDPDEWWTANFIGDGDKSVVWGPAGGPGGGTSTTEAGSILATPVYPEATFEDEIIALVDYQVILQFHPRIPGYSVDDGAGYTETKPERPGGIARLGIALAYNDNASSAGEPGPDPPSGLPGTGYAVPEQRVNFFGAADFGICGYLEIDHPAAPGDICWGRAWCGRVQHGRPGLDDYLIDVPPESWGVVTEDFPIGQADSYGLLVTGQLTLVLRALVAGEGPPGYESRPSYLAELFYNGQPIGAVGRFLDPIMDGRIGLLGFDKIWTPTGGNVSGTWAPPVPAYAAGSGKAEVSYSNLLVLQRAPLFVAGTVDPGTPENKPLHELSSSSNLDIMALAATQDDREFRKTAMAGWGNDVVDLAASLGAHTSVRWEEGKEIQSLALEDNPHPPASAVIGVGGGGSGDPPKHLRWDEDEIDRVGFILAEESFQDATNLPVLRRLTRKALELTIHEEPAKTLRVRAEGLGETVRELDWVTIHAPKRGLVENEQRLVGYKITELDEFADVHLAQLPLENLEVQLLRKIGQANKAITGQSRGVTRPHPQ